MAPRRQSAAAADQLCLFDAPVADTRLETTLEKLTEARRLVADMLVAPPEVIPLSSLPVYEQPDDHRFVLRIGRVQSDGERRGARIMRKMTIYLTPETCEELDAFCSFEKATYSQVIEHALIEFLESR